MKNIIAFIAFIAVISVSFLCFSQEEKLGTIERNNMGIITSVSFRDAGKEKTSRTANDFFTSYLEIKEVDHFEKIPHKSKRVNFVHEHYDQYYKGVKVEGAGYNFHFKDGQMYFANGNYVNIENLNVNPSITQENAINSFLKLKNIEKERVVSNTTELLVKELRSAPLNESVALVYRIYLQADHINNDEIGFVDAHTGDVIATAPRLTDLTGTFATRYSGSRQAETDPVSGGHRLFDNTRGATIHTQNMLNTTTLIVNAVELIDNDNNWTAAEHAANSNDMGLDVHWSLQEIYDYLANTHGINSFDDNNEPINAYVRYGTNTDNASWDLTNDVLYFGQGASTFDPLASMDVVAHEFGHGITDFQIGWVYSGITASFHEGMSDIWGAILEHRIRPNATWRIGEQVMANGKSYLRNLQNTNDNNAHQKIANTFGSSQYNSGGTYEKSGVFSHWFYLLVNGGTGVNGISDSYTVNGINIDIAEDIIGEAVFNNYLDGTTTYPEIRTAIINAATAICDNFNVIESVTNAWYAVGVGDPYDGLVSNITSSTTEICHEDTITFTLNDVPTGATVSWSASPSYLFSTSSGTGTTAILSPASSSSSGSATINFTISSICPTLVSQTLWVGKPTIDFLTFSNSVNEYDHFCSNAYGNKFTIESSTPLPGTNEARILNHPSLTVAYTQPYSNSGIAGTYNWNYVPIPNNGFYVFEVRASNVCGTSSWFGTEVEYVDCGEEGGGEEYFSAYPNPSSGILTITILVDSKKNVANFSVDQKNLQPASPYIIELYNYSGKPVLSSMVSEYEFPYDIDTSVLNKGLYILKVTHNGKVETRRIEIKN